MGAHEGIVSVSSVHFVNKMELNNSKRGIPSQGRDKIDLDL